MSPRKRRPNRPSEFRTVAQREVARHLTVLQSVFAPTELPATYGDCIEQGLAVSRPCPHASCVHSLRVEINYRTAIRLRSDRLNVLYSCALHESRQEKTLAEVGERLGVTRERVRQIEQMALEKFKKGMAEYE
tara:strand:+ start:461 stop:859 length:399 start_codon:yes stop_codon:yes gene_type:complete